ncbi:unnamed protein product [Acanthoscelides obtectus]|nr:unnamed protein product [Acanthoscelides obtectus]CAK1642572.1 hypothetical protein AOBTE_LOCUS13121 [Acanthoscelides obtectus]
MLYYYGLILKGSEAEVRLFCNYHNMKLVSIESLGETEYLIGGLTEFLDESQTMAFWTSGKGYDRMWWWDSYGHPIHYTNWAPGQPSDTIGRNNTCIEAVLNTTAQTLLWYNTDCDAANYFICESIIES